MNAKRKTSIKDSKTKMTASTLMRLAGVSAMLAGLCIIVIGLFHPVNVPSSVTTATWVYVHIAATALGFFGLFGMAGVYSRGVGEAGGVGVGGVLPFFLFGRAGGGF